MDNVILFPARTRDTPTPAHHSREEEALDAFVSALLSAARKRRPELTEDGARAAVLKVLAEDGSF